MNNKRIILTMKAQRINDIIIKLISGEIKITDAMKLTVLSEKRIYRKKRAYKQSSIQSILHNNRNKSTNNNYSYEFKNKIIFR